VKVDIVAELMVRVCSSFLVIPSHIVDLDDDEQLRDLARQFLVPMLEPTGSTGSSGPRRSPRRRSARS
jgi:TetR/AcrR family transcriptional repressor of uid operon